MRAVIILTVLRPVDPWAQLTILLPIKDRVPFTQRWLDYARHAGIACRILLADGGADPGVHEMVAAATAGGLDVDYVRYPYDNDYARYYAKLADALTRVTTPFVVLSDNDDFFMPQGLIAAVECLHDGPEFVACGGQCAVFWLNPDRVDEAGQTYGPRLQWKTSGQYSTDTTSTAGQRLRERCLGANDVYYAVHRTELLRSHCAALCECNPHDLFLMEQLIMFLTAIAGRTRQLDRLYIARQQDSPGSSGGAHQQRFGDWYDRMLVPTWSGDFARFVDCTSAALARADQLPLEEAKRVVIESYKASVAPSLLADVLEQPTVTWPMPVVLQVVRRLVAMPQTSIVRRSMQALYRQARWLSHDFVHGTELRTPRAREAAREFAPVADFLTRRR